MGDKRGAARQKQNKVVEGNDSLNLSPDRLVTSGRKTISIMEDKKRILKERAKRLAEETEPENISGESLEVLEFILAYERYGIESSYVKEVYPLMEITLVPCVPSFILGIVNIRGQIISVIDIKKFFGLPEQGLTDLNKVIIIQNEQMEFGILADVVLGVNLIPEKEIQSSLPTLTGVREAYLKGVTGERLIVLDAGKLLFDKKLIIHDDI